MAMMPATHKMMVQMMCMACEMILSTLFDVKLRAVLFDVKLIVVTNFGKA